MKRYVSMLLLCLLCLGLAACQALPEVQRVSEPTPAPTERPPAPEYSLCLYLEDGNTRRLPLTPEANEALRDLIESAEPALDSAEGNADLHFVNETSAIFLDTEASLLTLSETVTEQGKTFRVQKNYRLTGTLDPSILPEWNEPQEHDEFVTLQDLIDRADTSLLDEEGITLETTPYEGAVPASAGNRCTAAWNEDGSLILRAQKLNLVGEYSAMTIQSVKEVQGTVIVSAAVLSESGTPVTVMPQGEISQVWFMEAGAFMDIIMP